MGFSTATNLDMVRFATEYGVSGTTAADAVDQAQRGRVAALAIGLAALAWTTIGLIRGVHYAFAQAWGMEITPRRGLIRHAGFFMVTAIVLVILFAAVGALQRQGPMFALLGHRRLVHARRRVAVRRLLDDAPPHDALARPRARGRSSARWRPPVSRRSPRSTSRSGSRAPPRVYGGLGVAIAILFYMFLIGYMLVGTAFVNSVWTDRAEIIAGRPWVLDPDGLPRWLRRPARWASRAPGSRPRADDPAASAPADGEPEGMVPERHRLRDGVAQHRDGCAVGRTDRGPTAHRGRRGPGPNSTASATSEDDRIMRPQRRATRAISISPAQRRFASWMTDVLVYTVVLNLFVEFVPGVEIDSFAISVLTAVLLKAMLGAILGLEDRVAAWFRRRKGLVFRLLGLASTFLILFLSKFVILEVVDIVFGDEVDLGHLIEIVLLIVAMMLARRLVDAIYDRLGEGAPGEPGRR